MSVNITQFNGPQPAKITDGTNTATVSAGGALKVDGSAATQPVSGTVTANVGTTNGLALDATLTGGTQKTKIVDSGGTNVATVSAGGAVKVDGSASTQPVSGTVTANAGTGPWPVTDNSGSLTVDNAGTFAVQDSEKVVDNAAFTDGTTKVLPAGFVFDEVAGTALTENDAAAARIDSKRAQVLVLEDATTRGQRAAVSAGGALKVDGSAATQPVSGTVTANVGTTNGLALDATLTGGTQKTKIVDSGGTNVATVSAGGALKVDGSAATQPISGTTTANQGTAAALASGWPVKVTDGTNSMPTGDTAARSIFHQLSDGTNGPAAVKAASTAPVASDKALVVVLSPNQGAIPTTSQPANTTPGIAFGDVALTTAGTTSAVYRTTYTEQASNFTGSILSSSANDASAGTGARQVKITYVDSTGATASTETVTLNGTTPVNLVSANKCFIEKMEVISVGSTGSNVGTITLKTAAAGGGTTVGTIAITDNRTFWTHHYVVTGKTCNITSASHGNSSTASGGASMAFIKYLQIGVATAPEVQISDFISVAGAASQVGRNYGSVVQITGPARIRMYTTTSSGTTITYRGSFDYYDQ